MPTTIQMKAVHIAKRTAGNVSVSSTASFATIDSALDLRVAASVGDVLEVIAEGVWFAVTNSGEGRMKAGTIDPTAGDAAINNISHGINGTPGWMSVLEADYFSFGCSVYYVVVASDIKNGEVKVRFYAQHTNATAARVLAANADVPFAVTLINHGRGIATAG